MKRRIKIVSTGVYLPQRIVTSAEIDERIGKPEGWSEKKSGVKERRFVTNENHLEMAVQAIQSALDHAGLTVTDLDCIISTGSIMAQPIPSTASLIQRELGFGDSGIPCFDINSTCLGFVVGLDTISYLVDADRYRRVLLVSSEIASLGLNWQDHESCILFGDGAVAMIIQQTPSDECSGVIASHMETYGTGASLSEIRSGGLLCTPHHYSKETHQDYLFSMEGEQIFKMAARILPQFSKKLLHPLGRQSGFHDLDLIIPHQASEMAMRLLAKRLEIPKDKLFSFIEHYGNMISASIPLGIHLAIQQKKLIRGNMFAIIGTSAGFSVGGMILEY